jgi:sirohydrochlorin cobaltochelatase
MGQLPVAGAHMELATPDIPESVKYLIDKGVKHIVAVPCFLFTGNHILHDIPDILKEEQAKHSDVAFSMSPPIGASPNLASLLVERASCYVALSNV